MASDNGNGNIRSKFQTLIDYVDGAHNHMEKAVTVAGAIVLELQKGADNLAKYRDGLIQTIAENGGEPTTPSIEQQMQAFVPKQFRSENGANDQR